jgi:6-phosphogluconolactonase
MMTPESTQEIVVLPEPAALAWEAADRFAALARSALAAQGRFTAALSGGSTPQLLHQQLVTRPIEWQHVQLFWSDERCVPPDHPDSNYGMAHRTLLSQINIPAENVHRLKGELDPAQAAQHYEAELRAVLDAAPRFDLILLGLGTDAHTASLFPGTSALHEQQRLAVAQYVDKLRSQRLTLTLPVINAAAHVIFLVTGADKAAALQSVWHGPRDPDRFPAQSVMPRHGRLTWLVDRAAFT